MERVCAGYEGGRRSPTLMYPEDDEVEMRLSEEDVRLFYKLNPPLLLYVNQQRSIFEGVTTVDEFMRLPLEEKTLVRNALYDHPELIDSFVEENPQNFSDDELKIVRSWNDFVRGRSLLFRYLKKYTIFLSMDSPPKAYGVLALLTNFDEILASPPPILIDTVLLPFKDRVIYDGFLSPYNIVFGPGIRREMNERYQAAKVRFGIITCLPWKVEEKTDVELLRSYLSSEAMRERYQREIEDLIEGDPELLAVYHQEMCKVHARSLGRRLSKIGVGGAWFAILEGETVASGRTKEEVEEILDEIIPAEKRDFG